MDPVILSHLIRVEGLPEQQGMVETGVVGVERGGQEEADLHPTVLLPALTVSTH